MVCRIVDDARGTPLLAAQDQPGGLYRASLAEVPLTVDGEPATVEDLADGMLVTLWWDGSVQCTYPMGFYELYRAEAVSSGADDRCGLALEVLEDLWNESEALHENITQMAVDIDPALLPQASEREAVAWRFGEAHGITDPYTSSWEELCDAGVIDRENLVWNDGCHFALALAQGESGEGNRLTFDAQKWRGGLGAIFFMDCTAQKGEGGRWSYTRGTYAIS